MGYLSLLTPMSSSVRALHCLKAATQISNGPSTHKAHRLTPAMAADLTPSPMEIADLVAMIDAANPVAIKRGPYKKRALRNRENGYEPSQN
jgi:hypothetical protein